MHRLFPTLLILLLLAAPAAAQTDADGDGYDSTVDCNDSDTSIHPGATEIVADGVDQDCDGQELCYQDADGDGYGFPTTVVSSDLDCSDSGESGNSIDCDDTRASVHPGATEIPGNGIDDDCDGVTDPVPTERSGWGMLKARY